MRKVCYLLLLFTLGSIIIACSSVEKDNVDEILATSNQYAVKGDIMYYVSSNESLYAYNMDSGEYYEISEISGKLYMTPWHILYVCENEVYKVVDDMLTKWKSLKDSSRFVTADSSGCYWVEYSEIDDKCLIYYSEYSDEEPLYMVDTPDRGETLKLFATEEELYCHNGEGMYLLNETGNTLVGDIPTYADCVAGANGVLVLTGSNYQANELITDVSYISDGKISILYEEAQVSETAYCEGDFLIIGDGESLVFSEETGLIEKSSIITPLKYSHSDILYNGEAVIALIGNTKEFFIQNDEECTKFSVE